MKILSSAFSFVALISISLAANPVSGYEYGESCCKYNGKRIVDCQFYSTGNRLRIEWSDGLVESYNLVSKTDETKKAYVDRRGGVWEFLLYPQGNVSLTNKKNGNTIFKPLRGCVD